MQVKNPLRLTKKEIIFIGRQCASKTPETAMEYLSVFDNKPWEKDHTRIGQFFQEYCNLHNIAPDDYRGAILTRFKTALRRQFVASMVRMYLPQLYAASATSVRIDYGFTQSLATTLILKRQNLTKMIREVVVQEKVYPEFRAAVDEITEKLKAYEQGTVN